MSVTTYVVIDMKITENQIRKHAYIYICMLQKFPVLAKTSLHLLQVTTVFMITDNSHDTFCVS